MWGYAFFLSFLSVGAVGVVCIAFSPVNFQVTRVGPGEIRVQSHGSFHSPM